MSRVYFIHDTRGERRAVEAELPLCVGGELHGDVVLPEAPADAVFAYIAQVDGHAWIQPADAGEPLFHNHELLTDSRWLKSGDQVQAGEALLDWTVKGDQVFITARLRPAAVELSPPSGLPPPELASTSHRCGDGPVVSSAARPRRARRRDLDDPHRLADGAGDLVGLGGRSGRRVGRGSQRHGWGWRAWRAWGLRRRRRWPVPVQWTVFAGELHHQRARALAGHSQEGSLRRDIFPN